MQFFSLQLHDTLSSFFLLFLMLLIFFRHFNESEIDRKKLQAGYSLLQLKIKSLKREFYDLQSVNSSVIE